MLGPERGVYETSAEGRRQPRVGSSSVVHRDARAAERRRPGWLVLVPVAAAGSSVPGGFSHDGSARRTPGRRVVGGLRRATPVGRDTPL